MPDIIFSKHEKARVQEVLEDLDPETHELTRHFAEQLPGREWEFVRDYARAKLRSVLETGLLIHSATDLARSSRLVDENAIRRNFLRALWTYNFSFQSEIENAFVEIAGGSTDSALCIAVEGLIELAEDRMFNTFEDAHALLLNAPG